MSTLRLSEQINLATVLMLLLSTVTMADSFSGEVHWDKVKGQISKDLFSMNLFAYPIPSKVANPRYRANVRYLKPAILRLHNAGTTRDEGGASLVSRDTKDWDYEKIRTILNHLSDIPGDRMFNIVHFPSWLDANDDKLLDEDKFDDFAKFCADLVRYTNKTLSVTYIKYWEVTNERDQLYGDAGKMNELAKIYNRACDAMKAVDPTIKVGGPAFVRPDIAENVKAFIDGTHDKLDFVSAHGYACGSSRTPDNEVYDKVDRLVGHMKAARDYCKTKTNRDIPIYWNEFNISWTWRTWDGRMKTNKGACFDALCYIGGVKNGLDGLFPWNECDGIYGKMDNKFNLRTPAHSIHLQATYIKGRWVETVDVPMVRMLGVINASRKVIVMVNRSAQSHSMTVSFTGWQSEPGDSTPVDHHRIDGSGSMKLAVSYKDVKNGVLLMPHSLNIFVIEQ